MATLLVQPGDGSDAARGRAATPPALTSDEKAQRKVLYVLGAFLVVGILVWYALSTDGTLKSKEVTTSEPAGEGATGTKSTNETQYADNVVILGVSAGIVFLLGGAFYARIRSVKIGDVEVKLGDDPPDDKKGAAEDAAAETVEKEAKAGDLKVDPETAKVAATQLAAEKLRVQYLFDPAMSTSSAEAVGREAAESLIRSLR